MYIEYNVLWQTLRSGLSLSLYVYPAAAWERRWVYDDSEEKDIGKKLVEEF